MFSFLFKYPWVVFQKGTLVFSSGWPIWLLGLLTLAGAVLLGWLLWRRRSFFGARLAGWRAVTVWLLQALSLALVFVLLWQPALSVSSLKPQQNIIALLVDDSRSMALEEGGKRRVDTARDVLRSGLVDDLKKRFRVKLYRLGGTVEPIENADRLDASLPATRLNVALRQAVNESTTLPVGAVVLIGDGADNAGGLDTESMAEIRRFRIPVHSIGIGRESLQADLEVTGVEVAARALTDSRVSAAVSYRQAGFAGKRARLAVRDGEKLLASRDVTLKADGVAATEPVVFSSGAAGANTLRIGIEILDGEVNRDNNFVSRVVNVESRSMRVLYLEGEPRWEMKFIRRALEEDRNIEITSILRTTQNKIYRQGIRDPKELEEGFPAQVEELFAYQAIILGTVEAAYFTPAQQNLIREFVDRRGGGLLLLGGRNSLSEGGWNRSAVAEILPVVLPDRKGTFHREPATAELTQQGRESLLCRLEEDDGKNPTRWKALPHLADYQEAGAAKPGAVVLAELIPTSRGRFPLLVTQKYGRGRTAVFATGGSWRWQMLQDHKDKSHEMFWQQLVRWLATESPGRVALTANRSMLEDTEDIRFKIDVRDKTYSPVDNAVVQVRILGPQGLADQVSLQADPASPGAYQGSWSAPRTGSYLAEAAVRRDDEEVGRDVLTFQRENGVAENFRTEQNRALLEKLATETGGSYRSPSDASALADEISFSEAGMTVRENRDLWDMPFFLLLFFTLRLVEWLLRRRWGLI